MFLSTIQQSESTVKEKVLVISCIQLFPWTVAHQTPLSMGFSRQEYWSGLPFPSPGDLPNPEIEPRSPASQADSLLSESPGLTIHVHVSPLSWISVPFRVTTEPWGEFPVLHSRFSLVIYFIYSSVYMSIPTSQFLPPPFWTGLFSTSVSLFLLCK